MKVRPNRRWREGKVRETYGAKKGSLPVRGGGETREGYHHVEKSDEGEEVGELTGGEVEIRQGRVRLDFKAKTAKRTDHAREAAGARSKIGTKGERHRGSMGPKKEQERKKEMGGSVGGNGVATREIFWGVGTI